MDEFLRTSYKFLVNVIVILHKEVTLSEVQNYKNNHVDEDIT